MTMKAMGKGFSSGASAAFAGLKHALSDKGVRDAYVKLVAALMVMSSWLVVAGVWSVFALIPIDPQASWWLVVLYWAIRVAGILAVLFVTPLVALTIVNLAFPLLAERLFYSALAVIHPARAAELMAQPGIPTAKALVDALARMALFLGLSTLAFIGSLIPVVGSIGGPVAQTYLTSRTVTWELLDPYFDKLGWRLPEQRQFVAAHRSAMVGFGVPVALLMMLPLVGPLVFGLAQAAAARLVTDVIEAPVEPTPVA